MKKRILFIACILILGFLTASSQTPTPKIISGGIINGKATSLPKPEYPPAAQAVKATGAVNVQVTIDENGDVIVASAVSGHPLLRQAAEQAARQSKFSPTKLMGQPAKVTGVIVYNFAPAQNVEERLGVMGLGTFLSVSRFAELDAEWESIVKVLAEEFSQNGGEVRLLLESINKDTPSEKRAEVLDRTISLIQGNLRGDAAWQFDFGKHFGELMVELKSTGDAAPEIDAPAVKSKLLKIKDFTDAALADFPADVLKKFKEIVKFADEPDLNRVDAKRQLAELIKEILNTISPN